MLQAWIKGMVLVKPWPFHQFSNPRSDKLVYFWSWVVIYYVLLCGSRYIKLCMYVNRHVYLGWHTISRYVSLSTYHICQLIEILYVDQPLCLTDNANLSAGILLWCGHMYKIHLSHLMRKGSLALCSLRSFKCICAATQKCQRCSSLLDASYSFLYSVNEQRRLWEDCVDAQARLSPCCSHIW